MTSRRVLAVLVGLVVAIVLVLPAVSYGRGVQRTEAQQVVMDSTCPLMPSDTAVVTGKDYQWSQGLYPCLPQYTDRLYTFTSVPVQYEAMSYLETANDDKLSTDPAALQFDIDQPATVYVALDQRIQPVPAWLSGFTDSGTQLVSGAGTFEVYSHGFPAGHVTLGGNGGTEESSMYTVFASP